jgi:hypothetical protein
VRQLVKVLWRVKDGTASSASCVAVGSMVLFGQIKHAKYTLPMLKIYISECQKIQTKNFICTFS